MLSELTPQQFTEWKLATSQGLDAQLWYPMAYMASKVVNKLEEVITAVIRAAGGRYEGSAVQPYEFLPENYRRHVEPPPPSTKAIARQLERIYGKPDNNRRTVN